MQKGDKTENIVQCLKTFPQSDMLRWTLERQEDVYHSTTREPLGRPWLRGHKIPDGLGTEVAFGKRVDAKANSSVSLARAAIAPVDGSYEVRHACAVLAECLMAATRAAGVPGARSHQLLA